MNMSENAGYVKIQKIGEGAYGVIYKAQDLQTKKIVALKKFKFNENEGVPSCALREISILKQINHPNIIKLISQIILNRKLHLVMDYCQMDLIEYLKVNHTQIQLKNIMLKLLSAVEYLHSRKIMHRDIQPSNILLQDDEPVLIDFGLSKINSIHLTPGVTQLWYRAPELLSNSSTYNQAIDIWSIGCVFVEIVMKKPLFVGSTETHQSLLIKAVINEGNYKQYFQIIGWLRIHNFQILICYLLIQFKIYCKSIRLKGLALKRRCNMQKYLYLQPFFKESNALIYNDK